MSAVNELRQNISELPTIEPDSLLEHLYTTCGLNQLIDMQNQETPKSYLVAWSITESKYRSDLRAAIELVRNE